MIIELQKKNEAYHFEAVNEGGQKVQIDASPAIGGQNKGARPMELLIMGLGGCSGIDIINILQKQKIEVKDMRISIEAEREKGVEPSLFQDIRIHYFFKGDIDRNKVERAISLSLEKYCSVAKTLEKTAKITHTTTFE